MSERGRRVARPLTHAPILLLAAMAAPGPTAAQPVWHVSELPVVSIGDGAGEGELLFRVRDAAVVSDGRLAVLDGGSVAVRIYSARGELLDVIGREGAGPGEFLLPRSFRVTEEGRLLVYDISGSRVTVFSLDGEVEDTWLIRRVVGASTPLAGDFRPFADGAVPFMVIDIPILEMVRRKDGVYEDEAEIRAWDGDGMQRILSRPRGPVYRRGSGPGRPALMRPLPFEEGILATTGPHTVVVGTSHDPVFRQWDREGEVVAEYIASGSSRRVSARDWALYREHFLERFGTPVTLPGILTTPDRTELAETFLDETPRGERMPLFDDVMLGTGGWLWVREYSLEGESVAWQAVTPGAGTIGRVELPREWEVFEFGHDYVLVSVRDEVDVESVRKYRIER